MKSKREALFIYLFIFSRNNSTWNDLRVCI